MDSGTQGQYSLISDLLERIFENLDGRLTEAELAEHFGYSVSQICRIFLEAMDEPLGDFIRRVRLERAAGQLITSANTVKQIALAAGYGSLKAFSKAFGSHYDCPPSRYRELNQGAERLQPGFTYSGGFTYSSDPPQESRYSQTGVCTAPGRIVTSVYANGLSRVGQITPEGPADRKGRLYAEGQPIPWMEYGPPSNMVYEP